MKIGILKEALKETELSEHQKYKVGAVIFKGNRILSSGHNSKRSSSIPTRFKKFKNSLHAEQCALNGMNWKKLKGASILVVRTNLNGNISKSYPCEYCLKTIKHIKLKWLYYTNREGEIIKEKILY